MSENNYAQKSHYVLEVIEAAPAVTKIESCNESDSGVVSDVKPVDQHPDLVSR